MNDKRHRFESQVLPHLTAAQRFARWLGSTPADADDVVQEAFLRAYRAFDALRDGDVKSWLFTIVRNCHATAAAQRLRRAATSLPREDSADGRALISPAPGPESASMRHDDVRAIERLLAALPQEYREVLVLREVEDMGYREIAATIGIPIGTVMSRLARARASLKTQCEADDAGGSLAVR